MVVAAALAATLMLSGLAQAAVANTWRLNRTHAIRTLLWLPSSTWVYVTNPDGSVTWTKVYWFRVRNIEARKIHGACQVERKVMKEPSGVLVDQTHMFLYTLSPSQTAPDQTWTLVYTVPAGEQIAGGQFSTNWCTLSGVKIH